MSHVEEGYARGGWLMHEADDGQRAGLRRLIDSFTDH